MKRIRCITNNPRVIARDLPFIEAFKGTNLELFKYLRGEILHGYRLMTHPLTGSIGPERNPYKSVVLSGKWGKVDQESLAIIDQAINYTAGQLAEHKIIHYDEVTLRDFQLIDSDFIKDYLATPCHS